MCLVSFTVRRHIGRKKVSGSTELALKVLSLDTSDISGVVIALIDCTLSFDVRCRPM
jgi:hypothetical protein